jgi:spermidine/putrescine transport system permease protein
MRRRMAAVWWLVSPPAVYLLIFFVAPLVLMAAFSFKPEMRGGLLDSGWSPTLAQYQAVFANSDYIRLLGVSVQVALEVALIAVILAYPLAFFLSFKVQARSTIYLTLLLLPFWTSYLLRIIAWKILLGPSGLINSVLLNTGAVSEPLSLFLYSRTTVIITLVYVWLPFAALPIYASMQRIQRNWLQGAADLGAPPWTAFRRITFPLTLPGVLASLLMVFIPTVGEYVTPLLVGGSRGSLYGNIIDTFFGQGLNWPLGSAMAIIMLILVLVLLMIVARLVDVRRFLG